MYMHTLRLFSAALLSIIGCSSGQNVLPPGPLIGRVGGHVTFTTTISPTGPESVTVVWKFRHGSGPTVTIISSAPGGNVTGPEYQGRVSVNRVTGSLELRELTVGDTGLYSVTLTLNSGASDTGQTELQVYEPVSNVTVRANATDLVEFNDTVSLTCSASGSFLSYGWYNRSSDITASERVHLSDDNSTLTISRVLRSDRGPLYCTVSNSISNGTSQSVFLNISFGPDNVMVTVDPLKEFHTAGSNLTLSCSAQSNPPAEFKWAFNGTMLNREGQKLEVENIQEIQSGNYTCWAHNNKTLRYKPSDPLLISVIEKISGANLTGPTGLLVAGNSSANLTCQAAHGTVISRKWLKDGQPLSPSNRITFSSDNSSLTIDPVQGSDNGLYQCRLINPVNTDAASYNLTVNYGPEDVLIQGHGEMEVGQTVVLTCSASSVPPATFTWTFNGNETGVKAEEYPVVNATFGNNGNYICVAANSVTGLIISSAPHLLTVKERSAGSQLGAILGGTLGAVACVGVAAGTFTYMKKKKTSSINRAWNTTNHDGGEPEIAYADVSHFRKVDGGKIQLGSNKAHVTRETGQAATDTQETQYAEVKKH